MRTGEPAVETVRSGERRALHRRPPEQERAISRITQGGAREAQRLLGLSAAGGEANCMRGERFTLDTDILVYAVHAHEGCKTRVRRVHHRA